MVEVLEGPPQWEHVCHCGKCKAKLKAIKEDLKIGSFGPNYGGETPERRPYFECPVCSSKIVLDWEAVPI